MAEEKDFTWYIAIVMIEGLSNSYYSFIGPGGKYFHDFKSLAASRGLKIVAENFDVIGEAIDRVGNRVSRLVKALHEGKEINDIQAALNQTCRVRA